MLTVGSRIQRPANPGGVGLDRGGGLCKTVSSAGEEMA